MVSIEEIQAAYYMVAATGVLVAAIFYILNLRMVQKRMKIDTAILYGNLITTKEQIRIWRHLLFETDFTSFEDWDKRCRTDHEEYSNFFVVGGCMNQLGLLMKEKVIDPEMLMTLVSPTWPKAVWMKIAPIVKGFRVLQDDPRFGYYGEFFFKEAERIYPKVKIPAGRYRPKDADISP